MNNVKKLPDAYAKGIDSNNYKLLQLANLLYTDQKCDLTAILKSRDLQTAYGKTLDYYGGMVGQSRGGATDEQYRIKIFNQIGKQRSTGACDDVIRLISQILGLDVGTFFLTEQSSGTIAIDGLTTDILDKADMKFEEVKEIINSILPIGVAIGEIIVAGTFSFGSVYEVDSQQGFGDIAQTTGGKLGTVLG